ncbi:MAG: hypothetical protein R2725_07475 [Solirubrobacterales bacterium]
MNLDEHPLGAAARPRFFVVSGPGGTGKSTVIRRWLQADPELGYVRNYTTRQRRPADPVSGIDDADWFHFVSVAEFRQRIEEGFFAQWANAAKGYASGTPLAPLEEAIASVQDLVFDYTPQLYLNLRRRFREQTVGIFMVPPSLAELRRRLAGRGDSEEQIDLKERMAIQDLAYMDEHDYLVVNHEVERALATLAAIKSAEKARIAALDGLDDTYGQLPPPSMLFYYDPHDQRLDHVHSEGGEGAAP